MIFIAIILVSCKPSYEVPVESPNTETSSADTPYNIDFVQINNEIINTFQTEDHQKIFPFITDLEIDGNNDDKIEQLKAEFERRNPTQVEKLSMNTAKGGPFNVSPEEYWDEKQATSNYSIEDDDNGKEQGQYVITANDVNGSVDWKSIADSLDDDDFMYHQTLNGVLKV